MSFTQNSLLCLAAGGWIIKMKICDMLVLLGNENKKLEILGNPDTEIDILNLCNRKSDMSSVLSYVTADKYAETVRAASNVSALFVKAEDAESYRSIIADRGGCLIVCENPEKVFYDLHERLCASGGFYKSFDFTAQVGKNCIIHKSAVIEDGVIIGDGVRIGANSVIRQGTVIEDGACIGCNSTIGSEGFQIITDGTNEPRRITHSGGCRICRNVSIGDNVCVCRSLFEGETYVGPGVKIDNLTYVAHNLYIGKNAVITAGVTLLGSCRIEEGAWIAPNSSILNRVTVGKYAKVGMGSVVTRDVPDKTTVYGNPARVH